MSMHITLRDYQQQAVYMMDRALNAREHPLCKLPTGSGKSLVIAELLRKRGQRALVLSHVRELLEQDARALRSLDPAIPQGYFSAGLREKRGGAQVVFGSVQSVVRAPEALGARNLLIIDEAHLCPRDEGAMYARVFEHFALALRAGFTATDHRLDSGKLTEGDDAWFSCLAYELPVGELIKRGFLAPLAGVLTEQQADLAGVASRGGDFIAEQAEQAVTRSLSLPEVIAEAARLAAKRRRWLVFAAGVANAEAVQRELRARGKDAVLVTGETPKAERDESVARFREGEIDALVNVGVFTTGFDAPQTDCILCLRPTKSPVLWEQMLGRGMRLALGKSDCLLLDFVGNLERLGGAGCVVQIEDKRVGNDAAVPARSRAAQRTLRKEAEFQAASLADPMKDGRSFDCAVRSVRYFIVPSRRFPGKRLLVAAYSLEDELGRALSARSFVCVEYPGAARYMATRWFARRGVVDAAQVPSDAATALALASSCDAPIAVRAYWDARMRCYLVLGEEFEAGGGGSSAEGQEGAAAPDPALLRGQLALPLPNAPAGAENPKMVN